MIVEIKIRGTEEVVDILWSIKKIFESCERIYFESDSQELYIYI